MKVSFMLYAQFKTSLPQTVIKKHFLNLQVNQIACFLNYNMTCSRAILHYSIMKTMATTTMTTAKINQTISLISLHDDRSHSHKSAIILYDIDKRA